LCETIFNGIISYVKSCSTRRKEEAVKAVESKKRKPPPKKPEKKKKLKTDGDEELAKSLAGRRSSSRKTDVSGARSRKAAALAALKRERQIQQTDLEVAESSSGSEMDFGDDDDSDEEYEDAGFKPWQKDKGKKSTVSRLDRDDGSDMDIDEEEDDKEKTTSRSQVANESISTAPAAGLEDFLKVTIPRRRLARWCNEPFFKAAVIECFVRLFIGEDDSGEKVYRLCEIVDVVTDTKMHKFPITKQNEKPVQTNKVLRLRFANSERNFPMSLVSDMPPLEADVQKYITAQRNIRGEVLSKRRAAKLRRLQDHLVANYTYTTEDIERNLRERRKHGMSLANLGAEQTKLAITVQAARDAVQEAESQLSDAKKALTEFTGPPNYEADLKKEIEKCKKSLESAKKELEDKLEEERAMVEFIAKRKEKLARRKRDQNWAKVNKRAVEANQRADREGYKVQQEADARKAAGEKEKFNPYARRKVKPKVLWEVGPADEEGESKSEEKKENPDEISKKGKPVDTDAPALVHELEKSTGFSDKHEYAIDEEGLVSSVGGFGLGGAKRTNVQRVRRGISLAEYLERKERGTL
jgi:RNA polymerase-associated protein RTF1